MKSIVIILLIIIFSKTHSQEIEKRTGEIKITKEVFYFDDYDVSKKTKTAKLEFYFDKSGNILETISYGRQHFFDLKLIGDIEQFSYRDGNLVSQIHWISSCKGEGFTAFTTEYIYDDKNVLTKKIFSNPLSPPQLYTYSVTLPKIKTIG